jgi:hypothetical protein
MVAFQSGERPFGADVMHCGWAAGRYGYTVRSAPDGVRLNVHPVGDAIELNIGV